MLNAQLQFSRNLKRVKELDAVYLQLISTLKPPPDISDILRSELAFAVSALDKLVHDLVRVGMLQIFQGNRPITPSYDNFRISLATQSKIMNPAAGFNAAYWLEQEIINHHKTNSFQSPENIAQALSLIILENHKWFKIGQILALPEQDVRQTLSSIVDRRNKIVHEGDFNPATQDLFAIDHPTTKGAVEFIERLGNAIFDLCK